MSNTSTEQLRRSETAQESAPEREHVIAHVEALIAEIAHSKWLKAGKPVGRCEVFWEEAETEVIRHLRTGTLR